MPRNATTGVYARVTNSFSQPVFGTLIDPTDADALFDDQDVGMNPPVLAGPIAIVSTSASALAVGRQGATNPAFRVDASAGTQVAGLLVSGAATGGTVAAVVTDSGANANFTLNAKGTGTIDIGTTSTGRANLGNGNAAVNASVATPAGGSTSARLLFGSTAGFGIYYGSGVPTVSAAQGSLYMRSDGAINARLYINTNGSTTWTAFNTLA